MLSNKSKQGTKEFCNVIGKEMERKKGHFFLWQEVSVNFAQPPCGALRKQSILDNYFDMVNKYSKNVCHTNTICQKENGIGRQTYKLKCHKRANEWATKSGQIEP